ncbi:MAG: hypothetical protein ABI855_08825, partial [Bacteroidota bacterium]
AQTIDYLCMEMSNQFYFTKHALIEMELKALTRRCMLFAHVTRKRFTLLHPINQAGNCGKLIIKQKKYLKHDVQHLQYW